MLLMGLRMEPVYQLLHHEHQHLEQCLDFSTAKHTRDGMK